MLDSETKARIDSARDILVGKVPDPKSQVEQITIALIYKFMDDMDRQSEELGGKATFFSGEYNKYAWGQLLDRRFSGHERLLLYAEGIEKMNENKSIPQLFRDIFKGVFLPYRDPETLNLFLKEINGFSYDHSERLGDAFEYLLSVMDSQGAAGQFRTPRHIINFIVKIVEPKKNETILDPACGTAGFLISSYKNILVQHQKPSSELTPDERGRLMTNFCGYDISPDMVRLSRVNMYLHGFANPRIHEYDTLTSEERWDERYDVILANPPFMTPKGGIRPHNRFSIKATRSEVLFVDYIAEHLNVNGRAGIIVPEGIIFQSQNAYKKLRKMLVENYLWCVVSLPAGCFNPYSGVKTSILFLDKSFAKRTDEILFVKVENDGFDLGAQRKPIEKNDLPEALAVISRCPSGLDPESSAFPDSPVKPANDKSPLVHSVSRKRILESGDCNLSGDRYRDTDAHASTKWPIGRLGNIVAVNRELCDPGLLYGEDTFVYIDISSVENGTGRMSFGNRIKGAEAPSRAKRVIRQGDIVLSTVRPNLQAFAYLENVPKNAVASTGFAVLSPEPEKVNGRFLYNLLFSEPVMKQMLRRMGKGSYPSITQEDVSGIEIPLPPLEVQEKVVVELDGYRKIIEGAKQVIANYKATIRIDSIWPTKKVAELCELVRGSSPRPKADPRYYGGDVPRLMVADVTRDGMYVTPQIDFLTEEGAKYSRFMKKNEVVMAVSGNPGLPSILAVDAYIHDGFVGFRNIDQELLSEFLYFVLVSFKEHSDSQSIGAVFKNLTTDQIKDFDIPLPPLDVQRKIVEEVEAERELVEANRKLIKIYEQKIQTKLAEIWGKEKS